MIAEKIRLLLTPRGLKIAGQSLLVLGGNIISLLNSSLYPVARHDFWKQDQEFVKIRKSVLGRSMLDTRKLHLFYNFAKATVGRSGHIAEVGVYKGGTAKVLIEIFRNDPTRPQIHLFDTYEGMVEAKVSGEVFRKGDLGDTSLESVQDFLGISSLIHYHKGDIESTRSDVGELKFKFVHIDVDYYQSIVDCFDFFYQRLLPGGIIVFDDYGAVSCPLASKAVNECCLIHGLNPIYLYTTQAIIIKPILSDFDF